MTRPLSPQENLMVEEALKPDANRRKVAKDHGVAPSTLYRLMDRAAAEPGHEAYAKLLKAEHELGEAEAAVETALQAVEAALSSLRPLPEE